MFSCACHLFLYKYMMMTILSVYLPLEWYTHFLNILLTHIVTYNGPTYTKSALRISIINYYLVCIVSRFIKYALYAVYLAPFSALLTTETPMTLKSAFQIGQGHWKLHQWIYHTCHFLLVINCTRGRITVHEI